MQNTAQRMMTLERAQDGNTVKLAISSETPYERWFGIEILGHQAKEVDLSRLSDGRHPLLLNHDIEDQVGVIDSVELGDDAVLRGVARFSSAPEAQQILQDVKDGIRTLVSVGYIVDQIVEVTQGKDGKAIERAMTWPEFEAEQRQKHGDNFYRAGANPERAKGGSEPPVYRVTRWTPFEASLVAVPADTTVGVGRSTMVEVQQQEQQRETSNQQTSQRTEIIVMETTNQAPTADAQERARVDGILALGEQYSKYLGQKDIANAIRNGRSIEQVKDQVMAKLEETHNSTQSVAIGMSAKDTKRYSFGRALQAAVLGNWAQAGFERECSEAMARVLGATPEGFFVPFDIFRRDFNVGTTTEAGNLVATDLRGDLYVDALRANMVMAGMGVRILTGLTSSIDIPRKATVTTIGTATEIGSASESNPLTAKLSLSPKRLTAYVEYSKQAIIQSSIPLESMIRDDLLMGAAVAAENLSINGNGTAPQPLGIRNYTTIGSVLGGSNGAAPAWSHVVDLESACANSNAEPDTLAGYLINTRTRGKYKQTQLGTNLPFIWQNGPQPLNGYRVGVTNNVPNNLTKGTSTTVCSPAFFASDWSMAVMAFFGGADITVDPYSKADTGQVKIVLNQFFDFGIRQPGAFAVIPDLLAN
jgi:hypothetical protein